MDRLKKLAAKEQAGEKRRVDWPAATPTPKEVLEFFGDNVCPETGMPYHPDRVAPPLGRQGHRCAVLAEDREMGGAMRRR